MREQELLLQTQSEAIAEERRKKEEMEDILIEYYQELKVCMMCVWIGGKRCVDIFVYPVYLPVTAGGMGMGMGWTFALRFLSGP